ncbi:MAG TPA: YtxH domain-containing protein [Chloroflexia bacterium]|nr:YtxH domain-containing protein [Chloroflexia bacterium]
MSAVSKTLKFTGGVLLGLGIGTVTALLLAPQSGQMSKEQIQTRLDEILDAGRRAQHQTETELTARWESTIHEGARDGAEEMTVDNKPEIKAEREAERLREKQEAARKDAERHLEKASKELDRARTKL